MRDCKNIYLSDFFMIKFHMDIINLLEFSVCEAILHNYYIGIVVIVFKGFTLGCSLYLYIFVN